MILNLFSFVTTPRLYFPLAVLLLLFNTSCSNLNRTAEDQIATDTTQNTEKSPHNSQKELSSNASSNTVTSDNHTKENPAKPDALTIPRNTLESLLAAEFAGQRQNLPEALETYLEEARRTGLPSVAKRALQIAQYTGDNRSIAEAAKLWSTADPAAVEPHQQLAGMYISEQDFPSALHEFHEVYLMTRVSHYELLASTVALEDKSHQQALYQSLEQLALENRYIPNIWTALGMVAQSLGMTDVALTSFNSALEIESGDLLPASLKARLLAQYSDPEVALEWTQLVREKHPDNKGMGLLQGRLLLRLDRLEEARDLFSSLNQIYSDDATILLSLGLIEFDLGDMVPANHHLNELLATGKHQSEALYYTGVIALTSGKSEQAFQLLTQVPAGDEFLDAQAKAADILAQSENVYAASQYLQQQRETHPRYRVPLTRIEARLLMENKQLVDAMKLYTEALELEPDNTELLYSRAMLAGQMGKLKLLEKDLKQVIQIEPENADALNALGYTLIDTSSRLEEAQPMLEKALKLAPNNPAIIDSIGWLHFLRGQYSIAESYLKRAFEIIADHEIAAHYGELLWVTGRHELALKIWETGLIDNPSSPPIHSTMDRLQVNQRSSDNTELPGSNK